MSQTSQNSNSSNSKLKLLLNRLISRAGQLLKAYGIRTGAISLASHILLFSVCFPLALLLVELIRFFGGGASWELTFWHYMGLSIILALIYFVIRLLIQYFSMQSNPQKSLMLIDEQLHLSGRLTSAYEFMSNEKPTAFMQAAINDAVDPAQNASQSQLSPLSQKNTLQTSVWSWTSLFSAIVLIFLCTKVGALERTEDVSISTEVNTSDTMKNLVSKEEEDENNFSNDEKQEEESELTHSKRNNPNELTTPEKDKMSEELDNEDETSINKPSNDKKGMENASEMGGEGSDQSQGEGSGSQGQHSAEMSMEKESEGKKKELDKKKKEKKSAAEINRQNKEEENPGSESNKEDEQESTQNQNNQPSQQRQRKGEQQGSNEQQGQVEAEEEEEEEQQGQQEQQGQSSSEDSEEGDDGGQQSQGGVQESEEEGEQENEGEQGEQRQGEGQPGDQEGEPGEEPQEQTPSSAPSETSEDAVGGKPEEELRDPTEDEGLKTSRGSAVALSGVPLYDKLYGKLQPGPEVKEQKFVNPTVDTQSNLTARSRSRRDGKVGETKLIQSNYASKELVKNYFIQLRQESKANSNRKVEEK